MTTQYGEQVHAAEAPVILVGTHKDTVGDAADCTCAEREEEDKDDKEAYYYDDH